MSASIRNAYVAVKAEVAQQHENAKTFIATVEAYIETLLTAAEGEELEDAE